jgi:propionyl-CoA synthetase
MFDRFLPAHADKRAVIWVSNMINETAEWTLRQAYEATCKMANLLLESGVTKGDRVIIYMPMIPEALFATWAAARIGAIHSIVFGGFAAMELASRIVDCKPKAVLTASCRLEPHKKVNYVEILNEALEISKHECSVLIRQRPNLRIECDPKWK